MRKQVTFLEERNRERSQHGNGFTTTRSAGSPHASRVQLNADKNTDQNAWSRKPLCYKPLPQQSSESQHLKTIHIPKSMMMAPFLQHPSLTMGQKRYLCSIASIYSTDHMRRQMRQHYLTILRSCAATAAGHRSAAAGRQRGPSVKAPPSGHLSAQTHTGREPPSASSALPCSSTSTSTSPDCHNNTALHSGKLVLPQITNHNRNLPHISAPNVKSHRKVKSSSNKAAQRTSSKGIKRCTPYQQGELEGNLSSLSLEEEMDIVLN